MNKYFKFFGLKLVKFLNSDFKIEHISNKIASSISALSQIKNILPLSICLLVYNSLVRPHIEFGIVACKNCKNQIFAKKSQSER